MNARDSLAVNVSERARRCNAIVTSPTHSPTNTFIVSSMPQINYTRTSEPIVQSDEVYDDGRNFTPAEYQRMADNFAENWASREPPEEKPRERPYFEPSVR